MSRTDPLSWKDIDEKTQANVIRVLMHEMHIPEDEARGALHAAAANLISRQTVPRNPQALLIKAAINLVKSEKMRQSRYRQLAIVSGNGNEEEEGQEESTYDPEDPNDVNEVEETEATHRTAQEVREALDHMPERERELLKGVYFEGEAPQVIDQQRGNRTGTAKLQIHRAKKRLRRILLGQKARASHPGR